MLNPYLNKCNEEVCALECTRPVSSQFKGIFDILQITSFCLGCFGDGQKTSYVPVLNLNGGKPYLCM